jgi:hypothetical protein
MAKRDCRYRSDSREGDPSKGYQHIEDLRWLSAPCKWCPIRVALPSSCCFDLRETHFLGTAVLVWRKGVDVICRSLQQDSRGRQSLEDLNTMLHSVYRGLRVLSAKQPPKAAKTHFLGMGRLLVSLGLRCLGRSI